MIELATFSVAGFLLAMPPPAAGDFSPARLPAMVTPLSCTLPFSASDEYSFWMPPPVWRAVLPAMVESVMSSPPTLWMPPPDSPLFPLSVRVRHGQLAAVLDPTAAAGRADCR